MATETKTKDQRSVDQIDKLDQLRQAQKAGEIDQVPANKDESILIPETEAASYVHVLVIEKHHDQAKKTYIVHKKVIPFHANIFDNLVKSGAFNLYDEARVVHDPRKKAPKYETLKTQNVAESDVKGSDGPKGQAKSADMGAINRQKVELQKAAEELNEKEGELTLKEEELSKKADDVSNAAASLKTKEEELAERERLLNEREAQLKATPPAGEEK